MDVSQAINNRKSIRTYTGEPVTEAQLKAILKAANEAPVGMGKYDCYQLTVITEKELLKAIDANGAEFFGDPSLHPLYGAPTLILVSGKEEGNVPSANAAMIIHNMALEAVEQGVGQVDIYGAVAGLNQNADLIARLHLPEGFKPYGGIAVGQTTETYSSREIPAERIAVSYLK